MSWGRDGAKHVRMETRRAQHIALSQGAFISIGNKVAFAPMVSLPPPMELEAWFRRIGRALPEQLFREMVENAGFRDLTVVRRSPKLCTESEGSAVITLRTWRR